MTVPTAEPAMTSRLTSPLPSAPAMTVPTAESALPAAFLCIPSPLHSTPFPGAAVSDSPGPSPHHASFILRPPCPPRALRLLPCRASTGCGTSSRGLCAYTETKSLFGFASLGSGFCGGGADVDGVGEVEKAATRAESPKKVLILISNTGGVHRASAEAIKPAFF